MRRPERRASRRGFSLVEMMVALLISGMVVLGARMMLEQLGDSAIRTIARSTRADREANGERLLRDLAGRLDVGSDASTGFSGEPGTAHFGSWCDVPSGWQEPCRVALVVVDRGQRSTLIATFAPNDSVTLLVREHPMQLRYLGEPRAAGRWFISWGAGITAPLAIAVISGTDTMIVRIGERG